MERLLAFAGLLLLALLPLAVLAQDELPDPPLAADEGDPLEGRAIAERLCQRCHAIRPGEASPAEKAPSFGELGRRWPAGQLEEALAEGIMVAHSDPPMPDFAFSPSEIADLLAYLEEVARRGG